eukprot:g2786.t1
MDKRKRRRKLSTLSKRSVSSVTSSPKKSSSPKNSVVSSTKSFQTDNDQELNFIPIPDPNKQKAAETDLISNTLPQGDVMLEKLLQRFRTLRSQEEETLHAISLIRQDLAGCNRRKASSELEKYALETEKLRLTKTVEKYQALRSLRLKLEADLLLTRRSRLEEEYELNREYKRLVNEKAIAEREVEKHETKIHSFEEKSFTLDANVAKFEEARIAILVSLSKQRRKVEELEAHRDELLQLSTKLEMAQKHYLENAKRELDRSYSSKLTSLREALAKELERKQVACERHVNAVEKEVEGALGGVFEPLIQEKEGRIEEAEEHLERLRQKDVAVAEALRDRDEKYHTLLNRTRRKEVLNQLAADKKLKYTFLLQLVNAAGNIGQSNMDEVIRKFENQLHYTSATRVRQQY